MIPTHRPTPNAQHSTTINCLEQVEYKEPQNNYSLIPSPKSSSANFSLSMSLQAEQAGMTPLYKFGEFDDRGLLSDKTTKVGSRARTCCGFCKSGERGRCCRASVESVFETE